MHLHKRDPKTEIVDAATTVLDNYGIADLTMRRLARELGVTPGALYWHFDHKQQLLGAVADRVLGPAYADAVGIDWRQRIAGMCSQLRDALLSRTDGAELVSGSFAAGQSRGMEHILALLAREAAEAGLAVGHAELAARTIVHYVLGATGDEQSRIQWDAAGALQTPGVTPTSGGHSPIDRLADQGGGFDFGLQLLLDGIAAPRLLPAMR